MPTYAFETITPEQALGIQPTDTVTVSSGTASQTTVIFDPNERVIITIGTRSVTFGSMVNQVATLPNGAFTYADGSILYIGDGVGNTQILPSPATGAVYGGGGDDVIRGGEGSWLVQGNQGGDTIELRAGNNTVYGGQDGDRITFSNAFGVGGGNNFGQGNKGEDVLVGSTTADTLLGGQGDDTVQGVNGMDFLDGNLGNDSITGSGQILGEGGDDTIVTGFDFASTVSGGDGNDKIVIGFADVGGVRHAVLVPVSGDGGDDTIQSTNPISETLAGGAGNDSITTTGNDATSRDVLDGGDGDDRLMASGSGGNVLLGGGGDDTIEGGAGADTLDAGAGADTLQGGMGADLFVLNASTVGIAITPTVSDRILDWSSADHIQLRTPGAPGYTEMTTVDGFPAALTLAQNLIAGGTVEVVAVQIGPDVVIFADGTAANTVDTATLLIGRTLADISASNFV
ncbi:MAG TPA: hypothetical protein VF495_06920 [Phenylobacterium sp.]